MPESLPRFSTQSAGPMKGLFQHTRPWAQPCAAVTGSKPCPWKHWAAGPGDHEHYSAHALLEHPHPGTCSRITLVSLPTLQQQSQTKCKISESPQEEVNTEIITICLSTAQTAYMLFLGRIKSDYYSKFSLIQQTWLPKNFNARNVFAHSPRIVVGCFQERLGHTSDIQPTVTCKMQDGSEVYLSLCTSHCIETFII